MMMVNVLMAGEQSVLAEGKNLIATLNKQYHL